MQRSGWILLSVLVVFLTTGCEMKRTLTIRPDGSGEIFERILFPRGAYLDRSALAKNQDATSSSIPAGFSMPSAERIGKRAKDYGEGVRVIKYQEVGDKEMLGYEAVYAFPDVTKVNAEMVLQKSDGPGDSKAGEATAAPPRRFQFVKGEVNELVVPMKSSEGTKPGEESPKDTMQNALNDKSLDRKAQLELMKHIEIRIAIRVEGSLESTTGRFREGNEVVLWQMDLKGFYTDPKYADLMKAWVEGKDEADEKTPEDERYFKNEPADEVHLRFR